MGDRRAALFHPIALGALTLLLVNDHVLKAAAPGWLTGKLSDVAALVLAPLVGAALWQAVGRRWRAEAGIAIAIALWFAAVKLLPPANDAYAVLMGLVGWPLGVLGDVVAGRAVQPIGRAPTVLDPGDLIALPAVAVGWWLAIGAPGRWPSTARAAAAVGVRAASIPHAIALAGRIGVLAAALVTLAATSASVPRTATDVASDTVTVTGAGEPVHRAGTVIPASRSVPSDVAEEGADIRVQVRPRWPFNSPPARFTVTVGEFGSATGPAPVVAIPPERCNARCSLPVDVAIDWPDGAGGASTSVAWELVITTDAGPNSYINSGRNDVSIAGAATTSGEGGWLLGVLAFAPLAALAFGSGSGPRALAARPGAALKLTIAVAAASIGAAAVLVLTISSVATSPGIGVILGGPPDTLGYLGVAALVAIGWGLVEWRSGSGVVLAVALATSGLIALPAAGVLVAAASPSFAGPGIVIGVLLAGLLTVGAALAAMRPGDARRPATPGQLIVLSTQVAVVTMLLTAAPGFFAVAALFAAFLHAAALASWWGGVGRWLGVTSILIALGTTGAVLLYGPSLIFAPPWTPTSRLIQAGVLIGCVVGLAAAFGAGSRRSPASEDAATEARIRELVAASPLAPPAGDAGEPGDRESRDR